MICECCHGTGGYWNALLEETRPCIDCNGSGMGSQSFVCPRCQAESFNPNDIREQYCGHCHAFMGDPQG
jgi:hypothetical protein